MSLYMHSLISEANDDYMARQEEERRLAKETADAEFAQAKADNAAQPKGMWDSSTQTFYPDGGLNHGKAGRKYTPKGSDVWNEAVRQKQKEAADRPLVDAYVAQVGINDEIGAMVARMRQERAERQLDVQNVLAAAIKYSEGGVLPEEVRAFINRRYGWDGQKSGVLSGSGMQRDGNYVFNVAFVDANGKAVPQTVVFNPTQRFRMAQLTRGIFNDQDRAAMRDGLLRSRLTEKEVAAMEFDPFSGAIERSLSRDGVSSMNDAARQVRAGQQARMAAAPSGGNAVASVDVPGNVSRALFGRGGDNRSVISMYSNRDGGVTRTYNGHTGDDTGYVSLMTDEERANEEAKRLANVANAKSGGRMEIEQMKDKTKRDLSAAEIEAKEKRDQAYRDERKALREQNRILSEMRMLYDQKEKEPDQAKKDVIQKQIDELRKGIVTVANPDDADTVSSGTPDAILGRQPVLGQKNPGVSQDGVNGKIVDEYGKNSHPREGEVDIRSKAEADKAKADGGTYRAVTENDGKTHYYIVPAKKVKPKQVKSNSTSAGNPVARTMENREVKPEAGNPVDIATDDVEKEKKFKEWYSEKRKQHGMENMSEGDAREMFERDWWRKFKERVSKNLDDMDNYSKIHGNK